MACKAQQRHVRPDDDSKSRTMGCQDPRRHVRADNDANGPTTVCRAPLEMRMAQGRHGGLYHHTNGRTSTQRTWRQRRRPNDDTPGSSTTPAAQRRREELNHNTAGSTTTRTAQPRHAGFIDNDNSPTTMRRAEQQHGWPIHSTNGPMMRRSAEPQHEQPIEGTSGPITTPMARRPRNIAGSSTTWTIQWLCRGQSAEGGPCPSCVGLGKKCFRAESYCVPLLLCSFIFILQIGFMYLGTK